jgi:hypothetical protein
VVHKLGCGASVGESGLFAGVIDGVGLTRAALGVAGSLKLYGILVGDHR